MCGFDGCTGCKLGQCVGSDSCETLSESASITVDGTRYDALLFSAPLVAWTRYQLPDGALTPAQQTELADQIKAHIAAEGAKLAFVPQLGSTVFTRRDDIFTQEKRIDVFSSHQPAGLMNTLRVTIFGIVLSMSLGLVIGIIQAATSVNEQTLTFVPKIIAIANAAEPKLCALVMGVLRGEAAK